LNIIQFCKFKLFNFEKKNISESKILSIIKQYEKGRAIDHLRREHRIPMPTGHSWKKKYSGMFGVQIK